MNTATRLNNLEKIASTIGKQNEPIWFCICGEEPCICTEEHKLGKCKKYPSGSCAECKSSTVFKFMTGSKCMGSPIVDQEELPELLERVKTGDINLPIPILGGESTK